jgi:HEAT repeat protein
LGQALGDTDALVRRDAAAALAEFGPAGHPALPALLTRFREDTDTAVRKSALEALVSMVGSEDKEAAAALRSALRDPDNEVVRAAALGLAKIGGTEAAAAVPILCEALHDKDANARRQAAAALARVGPAAAAAVADLAAVLADRDPVVRRNAALALGHIGAKAEPAVPALATVLASKDEPDEIRLFASEALAQISPAVEPAIPILLRVVKEEDNHRLRQRAVLALGRLNDPERAGVVPTLAAVLSETGLDSRLVRYDAAVLLGVQLGPRAPDKILDVLAAYLGDKDIQIYLGSDAKIGGAGREFRAADTAVTPNFRGDPRYQAAIALGRIGRKANRPDIIRGLKEAAQSSDPKAREAAGEALRRIQN